MRMGVDRVTFWRINRRSQPSTRVEFRTLTHPHAAPLGPHHAAGEIRAAAVGSIAHWLKEYDCPLNNKRREYCKQSYCSRQYERRIR